MTILQKRLRDIEPGEWFVTHDALQPSGLGLYQAIEWTADGDLRAKAQEVHADYAVLVFPSWEVGRYVVLATPPLSEVQRHILLVAEAQDKLRQITALTIRPAHYRVAKMAIGNWLSRWNVPTMQANEPNLAFADWQAILVAFPQIKELE